MKTKFTFIISFLLLVSCQKKKPEFLGIDSVVISGLKVDTLLIDINYSIYNPNTVGTKLRQSGMKVYYKDTLVGNGYLYKEIKLPASDTVSLPVRCEIELATLSHYYPELISKDSSVFTLKGNGKVDFFMNSFNIAINDQITLNTQEIIRKEIHKRLSGGGNFKLKEISIQKVPSFNETEMNVTIAVNNTLPFEYTLEQMHLNFYGNGSNNKLGSWNLNTPVQQAAQTQTNIPVVAKMHNLSLLKQGVFAVLSAKKENMKVKGTAIITIKGHAFAIPIEESMPIDFSLLSGF
ncbi:LEA type 2 family protein [Ascidiimonas sp. W6]|uniref:LEA type 2 family protein n=1 Tax=Ascidiimonas meishanensis TaxID=3128903 RepID=UPI0030EED5C1